MKKSISALWKPSDCESNGTTTDTSRHSSFPSWISLPLILSWEHCPSTRPHLNSPAMVDCPDTNAIGEESNSTSGRRQLFKSVPNRLHLPRLFSEHLESIISRRTRPDVLRHTADPQPCPEILHQDEEDGSGIRNPTPETEAVQLQEIQSLLSSQELRQELHSHASIAAILLCVVRHDRGKQACGRGRGGSLGRERSPETQEALPPEQSLPTCRERNQEFCLDRCQQRRGRGWG